MSVTTAKGALLINGAVPNAYTTDGTFDGRLGCAASDTAILYINYTKGTGTGLTFKVQFYDELGTKHTLGIATGDAWTAQADQTIGSSGTYYIRITDPGFAIHVSVKDTGGAAGTSTVAVSAAGLGARG